jgi:hypothetical protein
MGMGAEGNRACKGWRLNMGWRSGEGRAVASGAGGRSCSVRRIVTRAEIVDELDNSWIALGTRPGAEPPGASRPMTLEYRFPDYKRIIKPSIFCSYTSVVPWYGPQDLVASTVFRLPCKQLCNTNVLLRLEPLVFKFRQRRRSKVDNRLVLLL